MNKMSILCCIVFGLSLALNGFLINYVVNYDSSYYQCEDRNIAMYCFDIGKDYNQSQGRCYNNKINPGQEYYRCKSNWILHPKNKITDLTRKEVTRYGTK